MNKNITLFEADTDENFIKLIIPTFEELIDVPFEFSNKFVFAVDDTKIVKKYESLDYVTIVKKNSKEYYKYYELASRIVDNKKYNSRNGKNHIQCLEEPVVVTNEYHYINNGSKYKNNIGASFKLLKKFPLLVSIFKSFKIKNDDLVIKSFALAKGIRINKFNLNKLTIRVNEKEYPITFKLKKGIKFIRKYLFNCFEIRIPVKDAVLFDIQNKIELVYDNSCVGRIIFNAFDLKKGRNRNSKVLKVDNKSIFLRQTVKNTMYLTVRETNQYDYLPGRMKIFFGWLLSKIIIKPKMILLFEKESSRYEESASVVFERLIDKNYKNVYYIINKDNPKLNDIDPKYKKHIIYKDSLKHIMYFFNSKRFIGTESLGHAMQLRIANKKVVDKLNKKNLMYVFLQHGVMYMVSLSSDLRTGFRRQNIKLHRIVVSSEVEANHFTELGGFEYGDLYVCGLPKFDTAVRNKNADKIVIMPTWRRWEVNEAAEDYTKTKYFKMIQRIVKAIPKEFQDKVIILPHPLMLDAIKNNKDFKNYIPEGEFSYDDILKECSLLITDYSSISYDAFYRGANVLFYWKEKDECMTYYGENAFLCLNEDNAFGDVCYTSEDITKSVKDSYLKKQKTKYVNNYKKIVEFDDNKNTDRFIEMIKKDKMI